MDEMLTIHASRRWPLVALLAAAISLGVVVAFAGYLRVQDYLTARNPPNPPRFAQTE